MMNAKRTSNKPIKFRTRDAYEFKNLVPPKHQKVDITSVARPPPMRNRPRGGNFMIFPKNPYFLLFFPCLRANFLGPWGGNIPPPLDTWWIR